MEISVRSAGLLDDQTTSYIDLVRQALNAAGNYFNHLSPTAYLRVLDTPHVWGMAFGKDIMPQAYQRQASFERAIVEIIQKTKYRCDLSSLNSPDPDWVRAIMGAMDTCLTARMGRTQPTQFRFLFGQTPMVPVGQPTNYADFKAALIRVFRERSQAWEVMPEIWMGRFYRLGEGIISAIQASVFGSAVIGSDDTKMTWNHTKIISVDGTEALVGGHNLNMDLFRSYPPVHDVSTVVHGEAAYGVQLFLNQMWTCSTDLLTKESLQTNQLTWVNRDKDTQLPADPLTGTGVPAYMKSKRDALIALHESGVQPPAVPQPPSGEQPVPSGIRDQDLQTVTDLNLVVFQERIVYNTYEGFGDYKQAKRMLTLGKYWNGPAQTSNFQKASEIMKEKLIKSAKRIIRMSQMDLVSAWKKNWSDHVVCQWVLEALLNNKSLQVQIVVSPLDAGAGAEGDQYSFGSGASRTFALLKYYMTHDAATDAPLSDSDGARANALTRLKVAPFFYTDKVPAANAKEGSTYKWPNLSPEGYTNTLKQPPLSEKPPVRGVIGSAAMSVLNASGYIGSRTQSAPGNHAKIMIVDDEAYVIGSDNLYPGFLSEVDYLVEGADAVNDLITSYWNPLWQYSSPHGISGSSTSSTNVLLMTEGLGVGGVLIANNKQYFAIMQPDGNLCVYRGTPDKPGGWIWGSQTTGSGGQFFTVLQPDGNLCTYYGTPDKQGRYLWGTQRLASGGQFFLIMQDDGNLCVYKGTGPDSQGDFVWGSAGDASTGVLPMSKPLGVGGTLVSSNKQYFAIMQEDGNFCVYHGTPDKPGAWAWGSQKTGSGGRFFTVLQPDGNLCTYYGTPNQQGKYLWGTQQLASGGQFFLIMQDDGNLCVYKGSGPAVQGDFVWGALGHTSSSVLPMSRPLSVGGTIVANNKQYFAIMQGDGNFCVYRGTPDKPGVWVWGSQKTGSGGQFFTVLQPDGNLCTYYGTPSQQGQYLWGTQRLGTGGQFFLIMQDDGNLCVYKGTGPADQRGFIWGSKN